MAHKLILRASQKYRDGLKAAESEAKAPRKIIAWVIVFQAAEMVMLGWLVYRSVQGG